MPKWNELNVLFEWGHSPDGYDRGPDIGNLTCLESIDSYGLPLVEELEAIGTRFRRYMQRKRPYVKPETHDRSLTLICGCGYQLKNKHTRNISSVSYTKGTFEIAEILGEVLSEWGGICVYGHRCRNPLEIESPYLGAVIRVEPFILNAPNVREYMPRMKNLGWDLARSIAPFVESARVNGLMK